MIQEYGADEGLAALGSSVLDQMPAGTLPADLIESLKYPTLVKLRGAAEALLAGSHLKSAEMLFAALAIRDGCAAWAMSGLARVKSKQQDPDASAQAWRICLSEFPEDAKPHWFLELARAERASGKHADAEGTLLRCRERFPDYAPAAVALGQLLASTGTDRIADAEAAWRAALDHFYDEAQPWWYTALASVLARTNQTEAEQQVVDALARRFPQSHLTLVIQARLAARQEKWERAFALWTTCCERHADKMELEWLLGRATALFRQMKPEAALGAWREAIDRFPHAPAGYIAKAAALQELGLWADAEQIFVDLISRFPDQLAPRWLAGQARCLLYLRRDDEAKLVMARLERDFPQSSLHAGLALERAMWLTHGLDSLVPLITDGVRRFPEDRDLTCRFARILMAAGRFAEAEAVVDRLEATGDDHLALIARWRIILDRDGDEALRHAVLSARQDRVWTIELVMAFYNFLVGVWPIWAIDLMLVLLDEAIERFPGQIGLHCARTFTLISLNQNSRAIKVIDAIPSLFRTREVLQLRAWAAEQRGELKAAQQYCRTILSENYCSSLHGPEPSLDLITRDQDLPIAGGVTVFLSVRNELNRLTEFVKHHRRLGIRRFVVVDNMSTDGGFEYLGEQTDVILYRTADHFQAAGNGMRWINWLIQRHGDGGWCLFADADEAFIYPGWETLPLDRFCQYLDREGAEGVAAFMLDVYPERLWDAAGQPLKHGEYRYYDSNYVWLGHVKPPYRQPVGGVRSRLFGAEEYLHKLPLVKAGRGVYTGNHETTPLRLADVTGALLHYKMLSLAEKRLNPRLRADGNPFMANVNPDMMRRYERYNTHLERLVGMDLRLPGVTQTLTHSMEVADQGLMRAPAGFRRWLTESGNFDA